VSKVLPDAVVVHRHRLEATPFPHVTEVINTVEEFRELAR